jgi:hypothetical protein
MLAVMPKSRLQSQEEYYQSIEPLARFTFGLKAPGTKRQYPRRLEVFLDFLQFESDSFETKVLEFIQVYHDNIGKQK